VLLALWWWWWWWGGKGGAGGCCRRRQPEQQAAGHSQPQQLSAGCLHTTSEATSSGLSKLVKMTRDRALVAKTKILSRRFAGGVAGENDIAGGVAGEILARLLVDTSSICW